MVQNPDQTPMPIIPLPKDTIILILRNVGVGQLAALARTCQFFNSLVSPYMGFEYLMSKSRHFPFDGCRSLDGQTIYLRTLALFAAFLFRALAGTHARRCDTMY